MISCSCNSLLSDIHGNVAVIISFAVAGSLAVVLLAIIITIAIAIAIISSRKKKQFEVGSPETTEGTVLTNLDPTSVVY